MEQPNGLTQEKLEPLAAEFSAAVAKANERLNECIGLIRKGLRSEALQRVRMAPNLLDVASELEFPELGDWIEILQFYGIDIPDNLDTDAVTQVNEALLEEQPLEELLRQHRRLAIAKAPLAWRLKVLRHIADVDSMNPVWLDDIQAWETVRVTQLSSDFQRLAANPDLEKELFNLKDELAFPKWLVKPPVDLSEKVSKLCLQRVYAKQIAESKTLVDSLHNAFAAGDEATAMKLADEWKASLGKLVLPPPRELVEEVAPALEWVQDRIRERAQEEKYDGLRQTLEGLLLKSTSSEFELNSAYRDLLALQLGVEPLLEQRYKTRVREMQQNAKRKQTLSLTAIVATALFLAAGAGFWLWNRNYRAAVEASVVRLEQLIEKDELLQANTVYESLMAQSPSVARASEVIALKTSIDAKMLAEANRMEQAANAIEDADAQTPDGLSLDKIVAAEKMVKTEEEKAKVKSIRARFEEYQRKIADDELQLLRIDLKGLESKLEDLKKTPLVSVDDAALEGVLFDMKALSEKYPKARLQGNSLVDLCIQRATSVRDSFRKQKREMERKQEGLSGIRAAKSVDEYEAQLKKFKDALPEDVYSLEFQESLKEASLWGSIEQWNQWCNDLAQQSASGLSEKSASELNQRLESLRTTLSNLPGGSNVENFRMMASSFSKRGQVLTDLVEELKDSVIIELKTLTDMQSRRVFVHQEDVADITKKTSRNTPTTTSSIPAISDATGSVSNLDFRGKLTITEEPRQGILNLIRTIDAEKTQIVSRWETQMLKQMEFVVNRPGFDGAIKELLFSRLVSAASNGSSAFQKAFADVQSELNDNSEKRKRWYEMKEMGESMNESLTTLYKAAIQKVEAVQKNDDAILTALSKSRLVWVGGILRDGQGKPQPNLYRNDVPDGLLWVVVPVAGKAKNGKLVSVGRVTGNMPTLEDASSDVVSGRPLFWTREIGK
jgi:primosomal protein N''